MTENVTNPSSGLSEDTTTEQPAPDKSTEGAKHVTLEGALPGTFHGTCLINPAAAERANLQHWNPAGSGVNSIIEDAYLTVTGADETFTLYASTAALVTEEATYTPQAMRVDEAQTRQCELRTGIIVGAGAVWGRYSAESNVRPMHLEDLIGKEFAPDTGFSLFADTTDGATSWLTVVWREVATS